MKLLNGHFFIGHFVSCFIIMLLPALFDWDPIIGEIDRGKLPVYHALESTEYKITLYSSLAVSLPMVLQLIFRICIEPSILLSFCRGGSNIILVMWIIATDIVVLWIVIPQHDLITYNLIIYLRAISLVWSIGIYLYLYSECSIWQSQLTVGAFVSIISTRVISYYDIFFKTPFLLQQLNSIFVAVCYILILIQCMRWFIITRHIHKTKQMSSREIHCGIYIISMLGGTIAAFCIFGYYMDALWYQSDSSNLCAQTIAYTIFYLIFTVFQGSAFEREAQTSKVALEVKQLFIRYMSHEMRTPLNTVMMGLQHLKEEIKKPGVDKIHNLEEVVEEIQESCDIALRTLNDMLLHDKIEAGSLALDSENVRVVPLVEDVVRELQIQARQLGIKLTMVYLDSSNISSSNNGNIALADWNNLFVSADPNKLCQVFRNIISNALKFTPRNGCVNVRISKVIDDIRFNTDNNIKIEIMDSGVGISIANQQKLFHGIIQFSPGQLQQGGGSGLGLFISKGIVNAHHGNLTVTSEGEGRGSTFTVVLPLLTTLTTATEALVQYITPPSRNHLGGGGGATASIHPMTMTMNTPSITLSGRMKIENGEGEGVGVQKIGTKDNSKYLPSQSSSGGNTTSLLHLSCGSHSKRLVEVRSEVKSDVATESEVRLTEMKPTGENSVDDSEEWKPVILVVDDVVSNRKMLKRLLVGRCSYTIDAVDGQEAVEKVKEAMTTGITIDVITMDYQMPVMDGPTATRKIRELGYSGIILGVTGNVLPLDINNFLAAGANRILTKPLNINTFDALLQELLQKKEF